MSYYRGDYYRGDYYQGDVFGFLKRTVKKIGTALIPSPIRTVGEMFLKQGAGRALAPPPSSFTGVSIGGPSGIRLGYGRSGYAQAQLTDGGPACAVKGTRPNKTTYVTRGGGTSRWPQEILVHEKGSECVKSRRINITNPRALRRAVRRAQGFAKLARRVMSFVDARAPRGRARFKRKR